MAVNHQTIVRRNIRRIEKLIDTSAKEGRDVQPELITALTGLIDKLSEPLDPILIRLKDLENTVASLQTAVGVRMSNPRYPGVRGVPPSGPGG